MCSVFPAASDKDVTSAGAQKDSRYRDLLYLGRVSSRHHEELGQLNNGM